MSSIGYLLPFIFLIYSLFCSIVLGRFLQLKTNLNPKSFTLTLLLGIPLFLMISMIAMIPTILINFSTDALSYYFYAFLGILFFILLGIAIYNRKLYRWKWIEVIIALSTISLVSIVLIFANQDISLNESNRILTNITNTSLIGDNFIVNEFSFCWVRYLSGWISLSQLHEIWVVNLFIQYGVFIFFSFFLTCVLFSIGKNILRWKTSINNIITPVLCMIMALIFAITDLDIVTGFLMPLFVLLTIVSLFFYMMHNPAKVRGLKLLIALLFNLAFLLDYNTWGISFVLMISLIFYQGYRRRAIDLWSFLIWFLVNMLNIVIIFSNYLLVSIALLLITGLIVIVVVRYLAGNIHSKRFILERNMWRYEFPIIFGTFFIFITASFFISAYTTGNSIFQWLDSDFWGNLNLEFIEQRKAILIILALLLVLIGFYGFYYFWFSVQPTKNLTMIIVITYIVFFFNPLVTPLYSLAETKELYSFGLIFLCTLLLISILNFFKEITTIKGNKFLALFPILIAIMLSLVGVFIYSEVMLIKNTFRKVGFQNLTRKYYRIKQYIFDGVKVNYQEYLWMRKKK